MALTMEIGGWGTQGRSTLGSIVSPRGVEVGRRNITGAENWMWLRMMGFEEGTIEKMMLSEDIMFQVGREDFKVRVSQRIGMSSEYYLLGFVLARKVNGGPFGRMGEAIALMEQIERGMAANVVWCVERTPGVTEEEMARHGHPNDLVELVGAVVGKSGDSVEHIEYATNKKGRIQLGNMGRGIYEKVVGESIEYEMMPQGILYQFVRWYIRWKGYPAGSWKTSEQRLAICDKIAKGAGLVWSEELLVNSYEWRRILGVVRDKVGFTECIALRVLGELEWVSREWLRADNEKRRNPEPKVEVMLHSMMNSDSRSMRWNGDCFGLRMDDLKWYWDHKVVPADWEELRSISRVSREWGSGRDQIMVALVAGMNSWQGLGLVSKGNVERSNWYLSLQRVSDGLRRYSMVLSGLREGDQESGMAVLEVLRELDGMGVKSGVKVEKDGRVVWSGRRCFLGMNKTIVGGYKWEALGYGDNWSSNVTRCMNRWCFVEGLCRVRVGEAVWAKLSGPRRVMLMFKVILGLGISAYSENSAGEEWIDFLGRVVRGVGVGLTSVGSFLIDPGCQELTMVVQEGIGLVPVANRTWERFAGEAADYAENFKAMRVDEEKVLGGKVVSSWGMRIVAGYPLAGWRGDNKTTDYVELGPWIKNMCYTPIIGGWACRWVRAGAMRLKLGRWFTLRGENQTVTIVPDRDWEDCLWFLGRGVGLVPQVYYFNGMGMDGRGLMTFPYYNGGAVGRVCVGGLVVPGGTGNAAIYLAGMAWLKNRTTISIEMSSAGAASMGWEDGYVRNLRRRVVEGTKKNGSWSMEALMARTIRALELEGARIELVDTIKDKKGKKQVVRKVVKAVPYWKGPGGIPWGWKGMEGVDVPKPDEELTEVVRKLMWRVDRMVGSKKEVIYGMGKALASTGELEWADEKKELLGIQYKELRVSTVYWNVYSKLCACVDNRLEGGKTKMMVTSGVRQMPGMVMRFEGVDQVGHPQVEWIKNEKFEPKL
jgi:hypothetical protein